VRSTLQEQQQEVQAGNLAVPNHGANRLTDQSVCNIVKAYAEWIGLKAADFGAQGRQISEPHLQGAERRLIRSGFRRASYRPLGRTPDADWHHYASKCWRRTMSFRDRAAIRHSINFSAMANSDSFDLCHLRKVFRCLWFVLPG
jgi:hypothetical protein